MAYVHTAAHRTASAGADVDNARVVVSYNRMIRPHGEDILEGLGDAVAAPASTGIDWGGLISKAAPELIKGAAQIGAGIYQARQAKKDSARQEDLARDESNRAIAAQMQIAQVQAQAAARQAQPTAGGGIMASIPGGSTTLIVGGVVLFGILALVTLSRRGPSAPATPGAHP
jgi:hypothetical protein